MAWVVKEGMPHFRIARRHWLRVEVDDICGFAYLKSVSGDGEKFILEIHYGEKSENPISKEEVIERCKRYAEEIFETEAF